MIRIKDLCKSFENNNVLKNLNLEINDGEIVVILGKSGSGKSVLLKHIIGLLKPNSGSVFVDEHDMGKLCGRAYFKVLKSFGMIFQGGALFDSLSVGENIAFYLVEHKLCGGKFFPKSGIKKAVKDALKSVGLEGTEDLYPSSLSGGMKKRASIARSVIYQPKYTLYDEPTTGLDPVTAMTIGNLILEQHKRLNGTTVVVSHDIYTTINIADRIALLENGIIQVIDSPKKFMSNDNQTIRSFNKIIGGNIDNIVFNDRKI